jgi:histone H3
MGKQLVGSGNVQKAVQSTVSQGGIKRPHRFKPGTVARREVHRYQHGRDATTQLLKKAPLRRLVRETMQDETDTPLKLSSNAFANLHEAVEDELVKVFTTAGIAAKHAGRITIYSRDMALAENIRKAHPNPVMGYQFSCADTAGPVHRTAGSRSRSRKSASSKKQAVPSRHDSAVPVRKDGAVPAKAPKKSVISNRPQKAPRHTGVSPQQQQARKAAARKARVAADEESSEIDMTQ